MEILTLCMVVLLSLTLINTVSINEKLNKILNDRNNKEGKQ